ncbi:XRE family transcriptional regulator [Candidatus Sulfidibacterium hydrothermale]|uniref:XRE family transcriptional regulator n=1 Tax=Candidatus Sulfidibacterium hydrothermale TaxID=2875962 RepID=UPI001F0A54EC|nr:XRE family transcriptional regulator [Candidatus Sulfidibacterium hydrothermale]UBM61549.1 XRE family transcriptional regulator [Candidatus Sulfidibacterium hydrothermale]
MARINVNINPDILLWARQEAGYSIDEVAVKLSVDPERYKNWERKGQDIPFGKLQNLATYYKRQIAVFFLPKVPVKIKKPKDFRNLSPTDSFLSKEVLLTLRRSAHLQRIAKDLEGENYWNKKLLWLNEIEKIKNEKDIITRLRKLIGIDIDQQLKWKSESEAYRNWRTSIEDKLGILVFQFSMPIEELQGFCMTDNLPYIIVTNSNHSYTGRIFTIFHELAHIIRHQSGMCLVDKVEQNQKEEWACNTFAGSFLAPIKTIVPTDNLKEIETYSRKLKVSREVYLRRLKEEGLLPDVKFYALLDKIKATYKKKPKTKGFVLPEVKSRASRGETFYNIVFEAIGTNRINYTDAAHALGLRVSRLINEI